MLLALAEKLDHCNHARLMQDLLGNHLMLEHSRSMLPLVNKRVTPFALATAAVTSSLHEFTKLNKVGNKFEWTALTVLGTRNPGWWSKFLPTRVETFFALPPVRPLGFAEYLFWFALPANATYLLEYRFGFPTFQAKFGGSAPIAWSK